MVKDMLSGKANKEKAYIKMNAHLDEIRFRLDKNGCFSFKDSKKRTIKIEQVNTGKLTNKGFVNTRTGSDPIWYKVSVDGKYLNGDGWYGFINPPIMVPDGTKREIVNEITKEKHMTDNYKEDIFEAAKTMIIQAVGGE